MTIPNIATFDHGTFDTIVAGVVVGSQICDIFVIHCVLCSLAFIQNWGFIEAETIWITGIGLFCDECKMKLTLNLKHDSMV